MGATTPAATSPGRVQDESPGFLSELPEAASHRLLAQSMRINVPAGAMVYRDNEQPRVFVVLRGLLRVFLSSVDGRQVTVRYVRPGDVAGLALVVGGPGPMSIQAMTSSLVAALRIDQLRALLATDPGVARACAREMTRQLYRVLDDLSGQAFLSVRQRIVRQLLDLAVPDDGPGLVVRASHEELAEAVASAREVVTRNLHALRDDGLVELSRDGIVLLDPIALARESQGHSGSSS
jgi:CRP/FNR family cyclic AMP-dependent transcriptional regulator